MATNQTTILSALQAIHTASHKSKLELSKYKETKNELQYVCDYFQTNEIQSILLASFISLACLDDIELQDLFKYFKLEKLEFFPYSQHLQILQSKNILEKRTARNQLKENYTLKPHLINYIVANEPIPQQLISLEEKEDSFQQFLSEIDQLSTQKDRDEIDYRFFKYQFENLLQSYKKYKLIDFAIKNLELIDAFVFFDVIIDGIAAGENNFQSSLQSTVGDFTLTHRDGFNYISDFLQGETMLNKLNLIEKDCSTFSNKHKIQLTQRAVSMLWEMENIRLSYSPNKNDVLIYPESIQKTQLYYNLAEQEQLDPVQQSLSHRSFTNLQKRLFRNKMPTGLTVLLHGSPGTGKTETVYQLAKQHRRPIFKVEIAQTKSMWYGESQKLAEKIFTDYNEYKKSEKIVPILLFNEADAVIGKRKSAGSSTAADTDNAIQNILLEELENFDGILFATSNLVKNMDAAFERRFLFKIKFEKPSVENAAKIWRSKLPSLSISQSELLATKFNFSGAEMQNIVRKCLMEEVVLGNKLSFEKILSFCQNENWDTSSHNTIGF